MWSWISRLARTKSTWGQGMLPTAPPSYGDAESEVPAGYGSIWLEEGEDSTGASSHSAFDGDRNTAWRFVSESDGSKVLEVDFTSVYAASGLLLRHADAGRTSTLNSDLRNVTVSVAVKEARTAPGEMLATTKTASWIDVRTSKTVHDTRRMLLDFDCSRGGDTWSSFDLWRSGCERGTWHLRGVGEGWPCRKESSSFAESAQSFGGVSGR